MTMRIMWTPFRPTSLTLLLLLPLFLLFSTGCGGTDEDGDGVTVEDGDCDDSDSNVYPDAEELCDGNDNDCDGDADIIFTLYMDSDEDGYGEDENAIDACEEVEGFSEESGDCNDNDATIYPGADELCNGIDESCNGNVDEGVTTAFYPDTDQDGFGPADQALLACESPDGYVIQAGDCDDNNANTYPGALELCDSADNNCDGSLDDGSDQFYYPDQDEDGFGSQSGAIKTCGAPVGYVDSTGDCDDADSTVYPGAEDLTGDGIDSDCGGSDSAQPSVGLSASAYTKVADALAASVSGDTIWMGPGSYREQGINFSGKEVSLIGTHGALSTELVGAGAKAVLTFSSREESSTVVRRLTISGGNSATGGGIYIYQSSPDLSYLIVSENSSEYGAGIYIKDGSPTLDNVKVINNTGDDGGYGAGIFITGSSDPTITDCQVSGNTLPNGRGAGIYFDAASPTLTRCTIRGNQALGYSSGLSIGGGIYFSNASPIIKNSLISGNVSHGAGGGLYLDDSSPQLINCTIAANRADGYGGGVYIIGGESLPEFINNIIAYNTGANLYNNSLEAGEPSILYSLFYNFDSTLNHNLSGLDSSNVIDEPNFAIFSNNGVSTDDDFHLVDPSPAIDSGDSAYSDPDGSAADMGAYGGSEADWSYFEDEDGDGMYDGWEKRYDYETDVDEGSQDDDGDGLTNASEYSTHTSPLENDTDGDGVDDGTEFSSGTDPTDWFSRPGESDVVALVPADFGTLQEAIDAVKYEGSIEISSGSYPGDLTIANKSVSIVGKSSDSTAIVGDKLTALAVVWSHLIMTDLMITDGQSPDVGGGLHLRGVTGRLSRLYVTGNTAPTGGGIHMAIITGELTLDSSSIIENSANVGGGLSLERAAPSVENCIIEDNTAGDTSSASEGVGDGAGLLADDSDARISNCAFNNNSAMLRYGSNTSFTNCTFENANFGVKAQNSSPVLKHCVATNNDYGVWIDSNASTSLTMENSILAFSTAANLWQNTGTNPGGKEDATTLSLTYNDIYQPETCRVGCQNHNVGNLGDTNMTVNPEFQESQPNGIPTNLHLGIDSPLQDAGNPFNSDGTSATDLDGSAPDMGAYGGQLGGSFNLDNDEYYDYFWSGEVGAAPSGYSPTDWDCDDRDPSTHLCS